jgi:hypothetical protein
MCGESVYYLFKCIGIDPACFRKQGGISGTLSTFDFGAPNVFFWAGLTRIYFNGEFQEKPPFPPYPILHDFLRRAP